MLFCDPRLGATLAMKAGVSFDVGSDTGVGLGAVFSEVSTIAFSLEMSFIVLGGVTNVSEFSEVLDALMPEVSCTCTVIQNTVYVQQHAAHTRTHEYARTHTHAHMYARTHARMHAHTQWRSANFHRQDDIGTWQELSATVVLLSRAVCSIN